MAPRTKSDNIENSNQLNDNNKKKNKFISNKLDNINNENMKKNQPLLLKIDGEWYDLTQWQSCHPGGNEILHHLNGEDATDAFYALHSKAAIKRLKNLPKASKELLNTIEEKPTNDITQSFRELRQTLMNEGYFDRSLFWELIYAMLPILFGIVGVYYAKTSPLLSIMFLGLGFQQAGWVGHDWSHSRSKFHMKYAHIFSAVYPGFSNSWWSNKHNTHHVYTNYWGVDTDIANDPIFHIWVPSPEKDFSGRRFQHYYYIPMYSFLYLSWRLQSLIYTYNNKIWNEFFMLCSGYVWMFALLPWYVIIGSILWGGWLVAIIVTATHQSEEIITDKNHQYCFVTDQFATTRNAFSLNPLVNYLWGGMQYQLEHHLFPTAPKYRYRQIMWRVKQWAQRNNIEYLEDGAWEILFRNYMTMKKFALGTMNNESDVLFTDQQVETNDHQDIRQRKSIKKKRSKRD